MQGRSMKRRFSFAPKLSERERILKFNAWDALLAAAAGVAPKCQQEVPPERKRREPSATDTDAVHRKQPVPLEKEVLRAVGELLAVHPLVVLAVRQNSGAASYEAASGRYAPVYFYKLWRRPEPMTITDWWGLMIRPGESAYRLFALDCKRPNWTKPTDERERKQAAFIALIRKAGGVGDFVRSAEEAKMVLSNA